MNYVRKSFSVPMGAKAGSKEFADRWEQTFGEKPVEPPEICPTCSLQKRAEGTQFCSNPFHLEPTLPPQALDSALKDHREGCVGDHCSLCGWCELPGEGSCVCYAR